MVDEVKSFLREVNVPENVIEKMMATPSREIYWLPKVYPTDTAARFPDLEASPYPGFDEWLAAKCPPLSEETMSVWERCELKKYNITEDENLTDDICAVVTEQRKKQTHCEMIAEGVEQFDVLKQIDAEYQQK